MPSLELLDRARLLVVTGKGGTGKTTVAAALAVAAGLRGRRTLVVEVEGRQGLAGLFGRRFLDHQERRVAERVKGLAVDPEASLREYLGRYGFAPLARLLTWARLTHFITAAAPGLGDVLLVGKVWEASTRARGGYDLVVLDAPPTGRVVPFLRAPQTVAELARVGPIRHQAEQVRELLDDRERTGVVLACVPEELPVAETLEGVASLRAAALPVASVVANRVTADRRERRREVEHPPLRTWVGVGGSPESVVRAARSRHASGMATIKKGDERRFIRELGVEVVEIIVGQMSSAIVPVEVVRDKGLVSMINDFIAVIVGDLGPVTGVEENALIAGLRIFK